MSFPPFIRLALCTYTQLWDLIVVGCGIAGSALAYAQAGVSAE